MWHLDEIVRRNNPESERPRVPRIEDFLDDVMAGEDAAAEATIEFIVPELEGERENVAEPIGHLDFEPELPAAESVDSADLWRRETITQYAVIDMDGYVIDTFDSYAEARDVAADDEQIVPLTGEGFVKAYL
jgi:hypothetical protein